MSVNISFDDTPMGSIYFDGPIDDREEELERERELEAQEIRRALEEELGDFVDDFSYSDESEDENYDSNHPSRNVSQTEGDTSQFLALPSQQPVPSSPLSNARWKSHSIPEGLHHDGYNYTPAAHRHNGANNIEELKAEPRTISGSVDNLTSVGANHNFSGGGEFGYNSLPQHAVVPRQHGQFQQDRSNGHGQFQQDRNNGANYSQDSTKNVFMPPENGHTQQTSFEPRYPKQSNQNQAEPKGDTYSNYTVVYNKKHAPEHGEEEFYLPTDQIKFFQKDKPEDVRTYEQLTILYKARGREIEELTHKLEEKDEEMGKEIRSLKHRLALATGEAEGARESLRHCQALLQQAKTENTNANGKIRALESQVSSLRDTKEELIKKLQTAESTIENLSHHIDDLQASESLSRARHEHESVISSLTQRYEREVLGLKEKMDGIKAALESRQDEVVYLKKQLADTSQELERAQVSRGETINRLSRSLEESQRQCQALLEHSSSHEISTLKAQLQQSLASKQISDDLCRSFQDEVKELKEQLCMLESASSLGVFTASHVPASHDDSMTDLGIRKTLDFSTPQSMDKYLDNKSTEDLIRSLKQELEKCIHSNKQKRAEVTERTQEVRFLREKLEETERRSDSLERTCAEQKKRLQEIDSLTSEQNGVGIIEAKLKKDIDVLKREKSVLLEDIEDYKKRLEELGASEAKLTEINSELSQQISQMVTDFDADKHSALERCQRTMEEVNRMTIENLRAELEEKHSMERSVLADQYKQEIQTLRQDLKSALTDLDKVKAMYVSLCEETRVQEEELKAKLDKQLEEQLQKLKDEHHKEKEMWDRAQKDESTKAADVESLREKIVAELKADFEREMELKVLEVKLKCQETHPGMIAAAVTEARQVWLAGTERDSKLQDLKEKYETQIEDLKLQHRKESENSLKNREEKFQNELRYFLKEREDRAKVNLENALKECESKVKMEMEKVMKDKEALSKMEMEKVMKDKEALAKMEMEKILKETETKTKVELEKALNEKDLNSKIELDKALREQELILKAELGKVLKEKEAIQTELEKIKNSYEEKYKFELNKAVKECEKNVREEMKFFCENLKSEHAKEIEKLTKEKEESKQGMVAKKNLLNALERERMIEEEVAERVKKEVEKLKVNNDEVEKKVTERMQVLRLAWLKEAKDYIQKEIQQGVEEGVGEERKKMKEEIDKNKETMEKNNNEEVERKVEEKIAVEFSNLKKKFVSQLNEQVLKEKSRLEQEVLAWRDEAKRKMEASFASKLAASLEERLREEKKRMEDGTREIQEEEVRRMREEMSDEMRKYIQRQRIEWEEEVESERREVKQREAVFAERMKSEVEARSKACFERDEAVKVIKALEHSYREEKQRLTSSIEFCREQLEISKREHADLVEKFKEIDQRHKTAMKDAKILLARKLDEQREKHEAEKDHINSIWKVKARDLVDDHQAALDSLKKELMRSRSHQKDFVSSFSTMKAEIYKQKANTVEEFSSKCKTKIRALLCGEVDDCTIKAVEQAMDIVARRIISNISTSDSAPSTPRSNYDNLGEHPNPEEHSEKTKTETMKRNKSNVTDHQAEHPHSPQPKDNTSGNNREHPRLDNVVLFEDTFYHTPSSSNQSSPAAHARTRARTRHHIDLPKTPCLSPAHLSPSRTSASHPENPKTSPRADMKLLEAKVRIANWARSGETPWKSSMEELTKDPDFNSYTSLSEVHRNFTGTSENNGKFSGVKDRNKNVGGSNDSERFVDEEGFVKPGSGEERWLRMNREKQTSTRTTGQSALELYRNVWDKTDDSSVASNDSFFTLEPEHTTQAHSHYEGHSYSESSKKGTSSHIPNHKGKRAVELATVRNVNSYEDEDRESVSSSDTEHYPLFKNHRSSSSASPAPTSTPLSKLKPKDSFSGGGEPNRSSNWKQIGLGNLNRNHQHHHTSPSKKGKI
ncbi:centrosomal protein of 152 kDa-like isoform X2 [Physella acuta]|uniref:centrosomal protein of 152 kDa-like isoform X2 n=1 Tax=Physella acuta TaxID=109671 RepID=UPI0027DD9B4E|nr:centrosomal protein of 152 kDa-like isoform X2 [Physella acuta]